MNHKYSLFIFVLSLNVSAVLGQTADVKLEAPKAKITTVSAMRARGGPTIDAAEIMRLKLGTVLTATAHSTAQDTIGGKTDFWYSVNLPSGKTGWVFGGLLLDYTQPQREQLLRQIIESRLKAENTEFADREEVYDLASAAVEQAQDLNTRAEFELLKLLALAHWGVTVPDNLRDKSPYREWHKAHGATFIPNEFGGGYNLRAEMLWQLESKYHNLSIADRIAWEAAQMLPPSDCEGDEACNFFLYEGEIKYLSLQPTGAHVSEVLNHLIEAMTDDLINRANAKGADKYAVQERIDLRKMFTSLRLALAKISASEKAELLKKLDRVTALPR